MLTRTQLEICVRYDAPVSHSRRVLRVLPLRRAGQTILREAWKTAPEVDYSLEKTDAEGNRRLLLRHHHLNNEFRFGLEIEVETDGRPLSDPRPNFARWKMPSRAVILTPDFQSTVQEFKAFPPLERAAHLARLCQDRLEYHNQTSSRPLKADLIWTSRRGTCADFAHVYLSLCRSSGLPARYVAGFNVTQGQMHAWTEIWCGGFWHAFDPTLGGTASIGNVAVCVGRDFYDCSPHTGTYRGAANAMLTLWCRTRVS